jgi:hypothetical protein
MGKYFDNLFGKTEDVLYKSFTPSKSFFIKIKSGKLVSKQSIKNDRNVLYLNQLAGVRFTCQLASNMIVKKYNYKPKLPQKVIQSWSLKWMLM